VTRRRTLAFVGFMSAVSGRAAVGARPRNTVDEESTTRAAPHPHCRRRCRNQYSEIQAHVGVSHLAPNQPES